MSAPKNITKPSPKKLGDLDVRVLSYVEQAFWETGYVPTHEAVANALGVSVGSVGGTWRKPQFRQALIARGIDLKPEQNDKILDPKQVMLANLLLNSHDKRSVREKLEILDVSSQQYHAWMRQDAFQGYLRKRAEEMFKAADPDAYMGLVKAVGNGDVNALKLFFEMRGIYNPRVQVDVNLEAVVVKIVEVVSQFVEPSVMAQISERLEGVLGGGDTNVTALPVGTNVPAPRPAIGL